MTNITSRDNINLGGIIRMKVDYCNGKTVYSLKDAQTAKNSRYKEDKIYLRIYECKNHYHLTSRPDILNNEDPIYAKKKANHRNRSIRKKLYYEGKKRD